METPEHMFVLAKIREQAQALETYRQNLHFLAVEAPKKYLAAARRFMPDGATIIPLISPIQRIPYVNVKDTQKGTTNNNVALVAQLITSTQVSRVVWVFANGAIFETSSAGGKVHVQAASLPLNPQDPEEQQLSNRLFRDAKIYEMGSGWINTRLSTAYTWGPGNQVVHNLPNDSHIIFESAAFPASPPTNAQHEYFETQYYRNLVEAQLAHPPPIDLQAVLKQFQDTETQKAQP